jgi:tetratricopeptide (TPR) repeat protein
MEVREAERVGELNAEKLAQRQKLLESLEKINMRFDRAKYGQALRIAQEALPVARSLGDHSLTSTLQYHTGIAEIELGETDQGIATLKEALWAATSGDDLALEMNSLSMLISVLGERKLDKAAAQDFRRHAEALLNRVDNQPFYSAKLRHAIARAGLLNQEETLKQLALARQSLEQIDWRGDPEREELYDDVLMETVATRTNNSISDETNRIVRADISTLKEVLKRQEERFGPHSVHLGPLLRYIGDTYGRIDDEANANAYYARAVELHEKPDAVLSRYSRLSMQAAMESDNLEKIRLLEEAVELVVGALGENHAWTADGLLSLAQAYEEEERLEDSLAAAARAYRVNRRIEGDSSVRTVIMGGYYALGLSNFERYDEADPIVERILAATEDMALEELPRITAEGAALSIAVGKEDWDGVYRYLPSIRKVMQLVGDDLETGPEVDIFLNFVEAVAAHGQGENVVQNLNRARQAYQTMQALPDADAADLREMRKWLKRHGGLSEATQKRN